MSQTPAASEPGSPHEIISILPGSVNGEEEETIRLLTEQPKPTSKPITRKTFFQRASSFGPSLIRQWKNQSKHWWSWHYLIDWTLCLLLIICDQLVIGFIGMIQPYERYPTFSDMNDATIAYPKLPDIVPGWALMIFIFIVPTIAFGVVQLKVRNLHDLHHAGLGLFTSIMGTMLFTDVFKLNAGRLRPDFMARCFPDITGRCTNPNLNDVRDSRLSFPSGHSSLSFCAMVYLSLYLSGKFRIFHQNHGHLWKLVIVLLPLFMSGYIAVSRTRDYHHNFDDVIAGGIIGSVMAFLGYFMNYPSFFDERSDYPKNRFYRLVNPPPQVVSFDEKSSPKAENVSSRHDSGYRAV